MSVFDRLPRPFPPPPPPPPRRGLVHTGTVHLFFHYSGCGHCWSMDGNWKLCFPYCMFPVSSSVLNLPKPKSAFWIEHYSKAQTLGYPTDVKGFLSYCGAAKTAGISLLFHFEDYGLYPAKRDSKISCP